MKLPDDFPAGRKLDTLVENKTSYTLNNTALHIFETHQKAERVLLHFEQPVLASMITGKKVMHLRDYASFDFLPGESIILPPNETMCIDFPEAEIKHPTRCLAMAISEVRIAQVLQLMNENMPKSNGKEWALMDYNFHFINDPAIFRILQRLIFLFTENHPNKDYFVDNMIRELIIRVLQTNERRIYSHDTLALSSDSRLAYVIRFIRDHLHEPLCIDMLSGKACMSQSHFHRVFKQELGVSPIAFINNERIKLAVSLLQDPQRKIKDIYMDCGFESRSYFNRVFRNKQQLSPGEYQLQMKHPID